MKSSPVFEQLATALVIATIVVAWLALFNI
jgi:hypothetical protein